MPELFWLLLPVAAAGGWLAAKRVEAGRSEALWDYASQFHQGLNVLLNDRQTPGIELFEHLSLTDRDTAETHLAIGNLFRRRGETERAILLHRNLSEKVELGADVQAAARFELARDYDSAGLLDRSEAVFLDVIEGEHRVDDAFESLLQLKERERDWASAIRVAEDFERRRGADRRSLIAHYLCEQADQANSEGQLEEARALLDQALDRHPDSARAHRVLGELALRAGQPDAAITHFERLEAIRPELLPEIIEQRFAALEASGDQDRLRAVIDQIGRRRNAYSVIRTTRRLIERLDGAEAADRFFKDQILKRPSLKGLRDWARDQLEISRPGERDKVAVICAMLDKVVEDKPTHQCSHCGFRGNSLHWRCPSCGTWDSVDAIIGVEGE